MAAVCHGPAALLGVKDSEGKPMVAGRTVACYTEDEEAATGAKGGCGREGGVGSGIRVLCCCARANQ